MSVLSNRTHEQTKREKRKKREPVELAVARAVVMAESKKEVGVGGEGKISGEGLGGKWGERTGNRRKKQYLSAWL